MTVLDVRSLNQLCELIGGDENELRELIEIYLVESKEILRDMATSQQDKNLDLLRRSAHSLKSSSQDFGATRLSELSASLESICRTAWSGSIDSLVEQIIENSKLVDQALNDYLLNTQL